MPSGEMRRPPQLWEQRLARTTSLLGVGISSSGDNTAIVPPTPPPGSGGGVEPAPVLPAPDTFKTPSTPTLSGTVQGIRVSWNGLNSDGNAYPTGAYVEVHISTTGATFTPDATTLAGTLLGSAGFFTIGALTAGTTYFVRLVGVDEAGNKTSPSTAASSQTGLTTSSDYGTATVGTAAVSFNARTIGGVTNTVGSATPSSPLQGDIWLDNSPGTAIIHKVYNGSTWVTNAWGSASIAAGQITALQIAAGAVTAGAISAGAVTTAKLDAGAITADKIAASTITGDKIAANTIDATKISAAFITASDVNGNVTSISGSTITSGTISGRTVESSSGANRVVLNSGDTLDFYSSSVKRGDLFGVTVSGINGIGVTGALDVSSTVFAQSLTVNGANADFPGVTTGSTTADAGFNGDRLRKKTSSQRYKYDITPLSGTLHPDVDADKQVEVVTVNPTAILDLAVAEFSWLEQGLPTDSRDLGFIAEDVAAKFPIAASLGPDGIPIAVRDTPILAALLAVVQDQQQMIDDLTARIEALEA
jgi:hypothetical protein